jgi:hypothetical protein
MLFKVHSFRNGETILKDERHRKVYDEVIRVLDSVTDEELKEKHRSFGGKSMSLSKAINDVLKEKFSRIGWRVESPIFQDDEYADNRWRLDFAKDPISIEVAFNHGEAIAWNLLKPVLASELNHVRKAIQTDAGIIITATSGLKEAGAFDGAVGEYEKVLRYLKPLGNVLTAPLVVIGLEAPATFKLQKIKKGGRNTSQIVEVKCK